MSEPRVTSNPAVMMGKPVIAGTRITVELVLEKLSDGLTIDDLLRDYPHLSRAAILAALRYARDFMRNEVTYPLADAGHSEAGLETGR